MSKKIQIEELTRVEGHGGIEIFLKDGRVQDVKFNIFEGPRFFEHAIKSVYYEKIPDITRRICAICTASHSLASIGAIEDAFKVKVTPQTEALRDLLIHGEMIESHALHVFMLALPDFLGFPDAIHMASKHLDAVKAALDLKKTGNLIHTALSGRDVHGMNDRVGGFSKTPSVEQLEEIKDYLVRVKPTTELAVKLLAGFDLPSYNFSDNLLMAIDSGEKFGFLGDSVLVSDGSVYPQSEYEKLTNEIVVQHIKERTRPKKQSDQLAPPREPDRSEQDWQSNDQIDHIVGDERRKVLLGRIDPGLVQETENGGGRHDEGDEERDHVRQREVTRDRQSAVMLLTLHFPFPALGFIPTQRTSTFPLAPILSHNSPVCCIRCRML